MELQHRHRDRQCLQPGDGIRHGRCDSYTYGYIDGYHEPYAKFDCDRGDSHCHADRYDDTDTYIDTYSGSCVAEG